MNTNLFFFLVKHLKRINQSWNTEMASPANGENYKLFFFFYRQGSCSKVQKRATKKPLTLPLQIIDSVVVTSGWCLHRHRYVLCRGKYNPRENSVSGLRSSRAMKNKVS